MFDASNYVLGPDLYCCWSLVLFWALFMAMMVVSLGGKYCNVLLSCRLFLRLLKLCKLAVCKLDLSRGGLTRCHSLLDHGLNLCRNIPLRPSLRKAQSALICQLSQAWAGPDCCATAPALLVFLRPCCTQPCGSPDSLFIVTTSE